MKFLSFIKIYIDCTTGNVVLTSVYDFCLFKRSSGLSLKRIHEKISIAVATIVRYKFILKQCFLASSGKLTSSSSKKIEGTKQPNATPKIFAYAATDVATILSF